MEFSQISERETLGRVQGVSFRIRGALAPIVEWELDGSYSLYFEHYVLMYRDPTVAIGAAMPKGAIKRAIGKMPVVLSRASGSGKVALGRGAVGEIVGVSVRAGQTLEVREHQFLAATDDLAYGVHRVRGMANWLLGGTGFFVDTFKAIKQAGVVWVHAHGNLIEVELAAGERLDVEPSRWCYKDPSVKLTTVPINLSARLFSSTSFMLNRFTGPGRLGLQSMAVYLNTKEP